MIGQILRRAIGGLKGGSIRPLPPPPVPLPDITPKGAPPTPSDLKRQRDNAREQLENQEACTQDCPDCVALQSGKFYARSYGPSNRSQRVGYAYQHFVVPWFEHLPDIGVIQEWTFDGVNFDGLEFASCHLYEAKYGHDSWFAESWDGHTAPTPKGEFHQDFLIEKIHEEARRQHAVVKPFVPEVSLTWVFSSMVLRLYMNDYMLENSLWDVINVEHRPYNAG